MTLPQSSQRISFRLRLFAVSASLAIVTGTIAWAQYVSSIHTGNRYEEAVAYQIAERERALDRFAAEVAQAATVEASAELLSAIKVALVQPVPESVATGAPVAQVILEHSGLASTDLLARVQPAVTQARAKVLRADDRIEDVRQAYLEVLSDPWRGQFLARAGFPLPHGAYTNLKQAPPSYGSSVPEVANLP